MLSGEGGRTCFLPSLKKPLLPEQADSLEMKCDFGLSLEGNCPGSYQTQLKEEIQARTA